MSNPQLDLLQKRVDVLATELTRLEDRTKAGFQVTQQNLEGILGSLQQVMVSLDARIGVLEGQEDLKELLKNDDKNNGTKTPQEDSP